MLVESDSTSHAYNFQDMCRNESQLGLLVQLGRKAGYALELQVYVFKFSSFCLAY